MSKIKEGLKYLSTFGVDLPNRSLGHDNLIVDYLPGNYPWIIEFIDDEAYFYGTGANSRDDYESGSAKSTLITEEDYENIIFQEYVIGRVEDFHLRIESNKSEYPESFCDLEKQLYGNFINGELKKQNSYK